MLASGVSYFWLKNRDDRGEYAIIITRQILVKLNRQVCPRQHFAFRAQINKIVTGKQMPTCWIAPGFPKSPNKIPNIEHQLRNLVRDVRQSVSLQIFITDLKPLEQVGYWSTRLQSLLDEYAEIEKRRNEIALLKQQKCLNTIINAKEITFKSEDVRWGIFKNRSGGWVPLYIFRSISPLEAWILQCMGINKGPTRWQWRIPISVLSQHYSTLIHLLPGVSKFHPAMLYQTNRNTERRGA